MGIVTSEGQNLPNTIHMKLEAKEGSVEGSMPKSELYEILLSESMEVREQKEPASSFQDIQLLGLDLIEDGLGVSDHEQYDLLLSEGTLLNAQAETVCPVEDIPWLNFDLIEDGLRFYNKYFSTVYITSWFALTLGLTIKSSACVVYRLKNAMTPEGQFRRALVSLDGLFQLHKVLMDKPQEINKFFQKLWKMHKFGSKLASGGKPFIELVPEPTNKDEELAKMIRKDLSHINNPDEIMTLKKIDTWKPEFPLNQVDMSLAILNIFLGLVLHPRKFGLEDKDEITGFIHVWAVIGRLLGVPDRFNICLKKDENVYMKLYKNAMVGTLRHIDSHQIHLLGISIQGMATVFPLLTLKAFLYSAQKFVFVIDGYSGRELWSSMGWRDKLSVGFFKIYFFFIENIPFSRSFFNFIYYLQGKIMFRLYLTKK